MQATLAFLVNALVGASCWAGYDCAHYIGHWCVVRGVCLHDVAEEMNWWRLLCMMDLLGWHCRHASNGAFQWEGPHGIQGTAKLLASSLVCDC